MPRILNGQVRSTTRQFHIFSGPANLREAVKVIAQREPALILKNQKKTQNESIEEHDKRFEFFKSTSFLHYDYGFVSFPFYIQFFVSLHSQLNKRCSHETCSIIFMPCMQRCV